MFKMKRKKKRFRCTATTCTTAARLSYLPQACWAVPWATAESVVRCRRRALIIIRVAATGPDPTWASIPTAPTATSPTLRATATRSTTTPAAHSAIPSISASPLLTSPCDEYYYCAGHALTLPAESILGRLLYRPSCDRS